MFPQNVFRSKSERRERAVSIVERFRPHQSSPTRPGTHMKHWITALLSAGLLASFGLVATAADNITIQFGTNTTDSLFLITDNNSAALFQVSGDNSTSVSGSFSVDDNINVDDNLNVRGGIRGARLATETATLSAGYNSTAYVTPGTSNVTLDTDVQDGTIYTIYNASGAAITIDSSGSYNNGTRTDCIIFEGTAACFSY